MPPSNYKQEVTITYPLYRVNPDTSCTVTIARLTGYWTTKTIWIEWAAPSYVKDTIDELLADGWLVDNIGSPSKPQEEIDLVNTTLVARKRSATP